MSRRNGRKLDLKMNLSPTPPVESPSHSSTSSSCVSLEESFRCSSSPEATSMMLVGCPRCLMYVMLSEDDPRCPKCKSTVLLDIIRDSSSVTGAAKKSQGFQF